MNSYICVAMIENTNISINSKSTMPSFIRSHIYTHTDQQHTHTHTTNEPALRGAGSNCLLSENLKDNHKRLSTVIVGKDFLSRSSSSVNLIFSNISCRISSST